MKISRILLVTLLFIAIPISFISCAFNQKPMSAKKVESILEETYGLDFTLVDSLKLENWQYTYTFSDPNGLEFEVKSEIVGQELNFRYTSRQFDNYIPARVLAKEKQIRKDASNYNLAFEMDERGYITISINSYKDIEQSINLVQDILEDVGEINYKEYDDHNFISNQAPIFIKATAVKGNGYNPPVGTQLFRDKFESDTFVESLKSSYIEKIKQNIITEQIPDKI